METISLATLYWIKTLKKVTLVDLHPPKGGKGVRSAPAVSLLDTTILDNVFWSIKDAESVNEVWDNLKALFKGKSRTILVDLGRKLQTTRCGEDDDVRAHFSKLANLRDKLAALGRSVGDDEYVAVLIGSLPPCYDSPIDALTSSCNVNNKDIELLQALLDLVLPMLHCSNPGGVAAVITCW